MSENVGFGANKLLISVPGCETPASVDWAVNLAGQYWPLHISIEYASQDGFGQDMDLLRNYSAAYALGTNTKYIWFVRENILPPTWAIHRLLEAIRLDSNIMIVTGMEETGVPESTEFLDEVKHVFVDGNKKEYEILDIAPGSSVGFECTLVRTELFDRINEPWFKSTELVSSSAYLCDKTMKAGFRVCAHTGVICGHIDSDGKTHWPADAVVQV